MAKVRTFKSCYLDNLSYVSFRCPLNNHLISNIDSSNCDDCPHFIRFEHVGWPLNRSYVVCKCLPYVSLIQLSLDFN